MTENLENKLQRLDSKIERLKEERNRLLYSNMKMVNLLTELEEFLDHEMRIGKIDRSEFTGEYSPDSSTKLDIEEIETQIKQVEQIIQEVQTN